MYHKSVFYALLMVLFGVMAYLFLNSGFNTETVVRVGYDDTSEVIYKVNYLDEGYNTYNDGKYVADMVDDITISYNYNNYLSEYVSGYYKYNVEAYVIAYEEDITDSLWERKYQLVEEKTVVLDQNNINNIKIYDNFDVYFNKYRDEINEFINDYEIDVEGYLSIRINILEFFNFNSLNNEYADNKSITVNIPLTDDTFKIYVNNLKERDTYYEFSSDVPMNIAFLIIGAFCFSISISLLVLVIKQFKIIYNKQSKYNRELKKILSMYDDCIVKVKRFYVNKKYNMIYVDTFDELMDVYDKKDKMISFKEYKRGNEAIFVIIDEDDAWIYKLISDNLE